MKNVVIFAIDNGHDLHQQAKFLRRVDNFRAMQKLHGPALSCIGYWEDQLERSYIMHVKDYKEVVLGGHWARYSDWVKGQKAVVHVNNKGDAWLCSNSLVKRENLGWMYQIDRPRLSGAWTYIEAEGLYYAAG
jgi:hypothetical protein